MTQSLTSSASLSRRQKLTTTHDVSQAWGGLGTSILTLWQQTKIAASPCAVILVFLYLTCISVLHVASSTIMQFQPYNASLSTVVPSNSTWPDPSVNLSALGWNEITPLVPAMSNLDSSTLLMSGLVNSTLYDTFTRTQNVISASVNASTIRANCGLLPTSPSNSTTADINAILSAAGNMTGYVTNSCELQVKINRIGLTYRTGKDEMVFLGGSQYECTTNTSIDCPLFFMVTTGMELNSSIQGSVSINTTWHYTPIDGQSGILTCTAYFAHVICIQVEKFKPLTQLFTLWPVHFMHGTNRQPLTCNAMSCCPPWEIRTRYRKDGHCGLLLAMAQTRKFSMQECVIHGVP